MKENTFGVFYDRSKQSKQISRDLILKPALGLALTDWRRAKGSEFIFEVTDDENDAVCAGVAGGKPRKSPSASNVGLDSLAWSESAELEAFLRRPTAVKKVLSLNKN